MYQSFKKKRFTELELNNEKFPKIVEFPQTHGKVGLNLSKIQLNMLGYFYLGS